MTADAVGGVWTHALELSRVLHRAGVEITLATMGEPLSVAQRRAASRVAAEICESRFRLEWMEDPWDDVRRAGDWLLDIEERVRPDVVHLNGYAHGALPWRAPCVVVSHSCVLSWWRAVLGGDAPSQYDRYRAEVACGLRAASAVVAPTRAMVDAISMHYGRPPNARVVHNAIDPRRLRLEPKEPVILAVGGLWDRAKNIATLGSVAARLPWPVLVAGSDRDAAGERRALPGVRALGSLEPPALAACFARAAIYAAPALYEPFGWGALEAGMSGCALVLGDIPSMREVWGDAASYVPARDPDALERTLGALIADERRRRQMAARADTRARLFTPEKLGRGYLDLYADALRRRVGDIDRCA